MATKRKIRIYGAHRVPVNEQAFIKIIRHYYRGPHNMIIYFDNRLSCWGSHEYMARSKTHHIRISPKWCTFNKVDEVRDFDELAIYGEIQETNDQDTTIRIIHTTLHELKHATQCDNNPIRYAKCDDSTHPSIENKSMSYEFSPLEAEAEGWSLIHINKALERYKSWCND